MNKPLGNILFFILSTLCLQAMDFDYHFKVTNPHPYVEEPILLTLDIHQTNKEKVLLFKFDLQKSPQYEFHRLFAKETDSYHNANVHYEYLIYPLKAGEVSLRFTLIQKATTDENLAYSFSGDRDNVKGLTTIDSNISLKPFTLQVKALPKATQLVGDFILHYTHIKHKAEAYEPLPFTVTIQGQGYPPLLTTLFPEKTEELLFKEKPLLKYVNTAKGTQSTVIYPMAFSHKKSFTLPSVKINCFNPFKKEKYTLKIPEQSIEIMPIKSQTLLDRVDTPSPLTTDFSWFFSLLGYLTVFFAGYLSALSIKWSKRSIQSKRDPFYEKIDACTNEKALLQLLIASKREEFEKAIDRLEKSLYHQEKSNFKKTKQEILEQLQ